MDFFSILLYTTPIWEYMKNFNPFANGGLAVIYTFILLFAIVYAGERRKKGAFVNTIDQIIIAVLGAGIIYFITGNDLLSGVGMIVVYLLNLKFNIGVSTKLFFIISAKLFGGFAIFALIDPPLRPISLIFIIFTIFWQRAGAIEKEDKAKKK